MIKITELGLTSMLDPENVRPLNSRDPSLGNCLGLGLSKSHIPAGSGSTLGMISSGNRTDKDIRGF